MKILPVWLWFFDWFKRDKDRDGLLVKGKAPKLWGATPAPAKFEYGPATAGILAETGKVLGGRFVSPMEGGTWLYVTSGLSREPMRERGGWRSPDVKGRVYSNARPKK